MRATRRPTLSALLVIGLCLLWVALALAAGAVPARADSGHTVGISGFAYHPAELTIEVGETVTWTNLDAVEHTATATDGSWDTGLLGEGESASITFTAPGTYDYLCTPHPTMTGRIIVVAASQPTSSPTPAPSQGGGNQLPDVAMPAQPPARTVLTLIGTALVGLALLLPTLAAVMRRLGHPDED